MFQRKWLLLGALAAFALVCAPACSKDSKADGEAKGAAAKAPAKAAKASPATPAQPGAAKPAAKPAKIAMEGKTYGDGITQTPVRTDVAPDGASGWHTIAVRAR